MTGAEFRAARIAAGLSYRGCADLLGHSLSTIQRYETLPAVPAGAAAALSAQTAQAPPAHETAYVLGRVLCTLERAYGRSFPAGIWTACEARPMLGLAQALTLAGQDARRDAGVGELLALLPAALPERLAPAGMAAFWLGYWHQSAELRAAGAAARRTDA